MRIHCVCVFVFLCSVTFEMTQNSHAGTDTQARTVQWYNATGKVRKDWKVNFKFIWLKVTIGCFMQWLNFEFEMKCAAFSSRLLRSFFFFVRSMVFFSHSFSIMSFADFQHGNVHTTQFVFKQTRIRHQFWKQRNWICKMEWARQSHLNEGVNTKTKTKKTKKKNERRTEKIQQL